MIIYRIQLGMQKILVLGSTGMLGHAVYQELKKSSNQVFFTSRLQSSSADERFLHFDFDSSDLKNFFENESNFDFVINCIGAIPQKYNLNQIESNRKMIELNILLPNLLNYYSLIHNFKVIQIATDCVFSGSSGKYMENSIHDATDMYGITKSSGEHDSPNFMHIRCSIVGTHDKDNHSLHNWILSRPSGAKVKGFTNHYWNGISTLSFAKIVNGVINNDLFEPGLQHLIPKDHVTKFELLKIIANEYGRKDIRIEPYRHENHVDRTLSTIDPSRNLKLWKSGGYENVPSIVELIMEMHLSKN